MLVVPYVTRCGCAVFAPVETVLLAAPVVKWDRRAVPPWLQVVQKPELLARTRSPPNRVPSHFPAAIVRYGFGWAIRQPLSVAQVMTNFLPLGSQRMREVQA